LMPMRAGGGFWVPHLLSISVLLTSKMPRGHVTPMRIVGRLA